MFVPFPSDSQAHAEIELLVSDTKQRVGDALAEVDEPVAAFAIWLSGGEVGGGPISVSAATNAHWAARIEQLSSSPTYAELAEVLSPQTWDEDLDLAEPADWEPLIKAHQRIEDLYGADIDVEAVWCNEAARQLAAAPPFATGATLLAFASDMHFSDDVLAYIRYASPPETVDVLKARGLLPLSLRALFRDAADG